MNCKEPFAKNKKHGKMPFDTVFIKSYIDSIVVLVIKNFHEKSYFDKQTALEGAVCHKNVKVS